VDLAMAYEFLDLLKIEVGKEKSHAEPLGLPDNPLIINTLHASRLDGILCNRSTSLSRKE
jgi:hypothetical protein